MLDRLAWLLEPAHRAIAHWTLRSGMILQCSGVNVDSDGIAISSTWLAMTTQPQVPAPSDAAALAPNLAARAAMRWALMVSDLAGELQPPAPSDAGPTRSFERRSPDGPHVPAHALRWHDTSTAAPGRRRSLGFR